MPRSSQTGAPPERRATLGGRVRGGARPVARERHLALACAPRRAGADPGLVARALGQPHPAAPRHHEAVAAAAQHLAADAAVADVHDAVGELRRGLVVADDDERRPAPRHELAEQAVDDARGARVELPGRLVGEQQRGRVGERGAAGDALLLAARERRGRIVGAIGEAHAVEQRERVAPPLALRRASERERQGDVVGARERGGERAGVVLIEEAQLLRAELGGPAGAQPHDIDAERARHACGGTVEARRDLEQRALAGAARAEHDAALAALDRERHALQGDRARRLAGMDAEDVAQLECELAHSAHCSPVAPRPAAPRR